MSSRVTQAILPVAGLGTRFLPWTKVVPKEMLPIGTRPIISYIVDECIEAGISDICFILSHGKEVIPRYFLQDEKINLELASRGKTQLLEDLRRYDEVRFHVEYQEQQLGDGHAILQASKWVSGKEVAVLFGDDYFVGEKSGLRQLLEANADIRFEGERSVVAVTKIRPEFSSKYGIVDVEQKEQTDGLALRVRSLVEKPSPEDAPSNLGIVGRYIIPRSTFSVLKTVHSQSKDGELRLADALISQLSISRVYCVLCEGRRIDTGTPEGYKEAVCSGLL